MIRITVYDHTGRCADNLELARRIAHKARGAMGNGTCVLIDFDGVLLGTGFAEEVKAVVREDKIKLVGLPISEQIKIRSTKSKP